MTDACSTTESAQRTLRRLYDDTDRRLDTLGDLRLDESTLEAQQAVFRALANENRLQILEALRQGELCACELQVVLDAPQSTVATHLRELKDVGLVRTRRDGKWTYYRIADTAALSIIDLARAMGEDA
ncbi:ArsR/SmtB family transcription factor [Halobacteriaceae archaeon GCM10025711]